MFCEKCGKEIQKEAALCDDCMQNEMNADPLNNDCETNETEETNCFNNDPCVSAENESSESLSENTEQPNLDESTEVTNESSDIEDLKLPKRIKAKRMRRVFAHIGASLLSLILAVLLFVTTGLWVIRDVVSPNTIKEMINNIDINEIKIDDLSDKELLESHGLVCESDNLFDIIYDNIDQNELPNPITKDEFRSIVEDEQFREYFGELFGTSISALISGDSSDVVTPQDVVDYLDSNGEKFSEYLGYELTEERLENLKYTLETDYGKIFEALGDQKLDVLVGEDVSETINLVFSDWLFWSLVFSDLLICGLIFLVLRSVSSSINYIASIIILIGVLFLCISALIDGFLSMFAGGPMVYIFNQLVSVVLWEMVIVSVVMIVVGICAPISAKILSRYKKRHVV